MTITCIHVARAVAENVAIGATARVDKLTIPYVFCPECIDSVDASNQSRPDDEDAAAFLGLPDEFAEVVCTECLRAWYPLAGLGSLAAAVSRARED